MVKVKREKPQVRKKTESVIDRIRPISFSNLGIKINIYGRSGKGKTTIACTFPKPLLLIGTEDGTGSVYDVQGVDFIRIRNTEELADLTEHAKSGKYATTVLDDASGLQDMGLREILGMDELPAQRSWGIAKQQEWGQCALETKERLRGLLNLNCHVVILAQEREFNVEGVNELLMPWVASALTPSVTGWLNPACDYICQAFNRQKTGEVETRIGKKTVKTLRKEKGVEYCLRTAPHEMFTTKFRLPKGVTLPEVIVDPTFAKINKLIRQGD